MSNTDGAAWAPKLEIDDLVFAKIAAFEAVATPGVARLHPYAVQAARNALNSAAKKAAARLAGATPETTATATPANTADPSAVDVDRSGARDSVVLTIRIVTGTRPPIIGVVREIQQRVNARVVAAADTVPVVIVNVLDVEPTEIQRS